jgi:tripartite-type tricarboxylate transporter receptor subunit TctC
MALALLSVAASFGCAQSQALAQTVSADDYPNRPVKIIVPFTAGGVADNSARLVPERLTTRMKQSFVVEQTAYRQRVRCQVGARWLHAPARLRQRW